MPSAETAGLVCGHHHLYSALARGMPSPPRTPTEFQQILEQVWWRLDAALDLDTLYWSAALGALEALECGTTAIVDHHESPNAIEGSLDVIAQACTDVGVRVVCAYGVTDRHGEDGARRGLEENARFLAALRAGAGPVGAAPAGTGGPARAGGGGLVGTGHVAGMVGVHAAFTCSDATLEAAAGLAADHGVGVHIHVAEGAVDADAGARLVPLARPDWLLVHCVHLDRELPGTIAHNPRSNMNNAVGYARPLRFPNQVVLGTDGIGADMLEEFRLGYARLRESDVTQTPETAWGWLATGYALVPGAASDRVRWSYHDMSPWHLAFTPGVRAIDAVVDGEVVLRDGRATRVDPDEVRARAAEAAHRLFARL